MNRRLFTSVLFACLLPFMVQAQQAVFRFAQLTDIHLSPNNPNPTEDLLRSIAQINATDSIDFVLVTGDIAEEGDRITMEKVKSCLDLLKVKYYVALGNHETKWSDSGCTAFGEIFGGERFEFEHKGFLFLGFNSGPLMRMAYGHVVPQDIRWMTETMERYNAGNSRLDKPVILVTHYPMTEGDVDNWYEVTDAVRPYNIRLFIGGHYHRNRDLRYDGIPGILMRSNLRDKDEKPGYGIYEITEDSILVYTQRIGEPKRQWAAFSLTDSYYDRNGKAEKYPDFSVNKEYAQVQEQWIVQTGAGIYCSPAVEKDKVFVGDDLGRLTAYALKNGKKLWSFQFGTPAVSEGIVVFGSADCKIYGLDAQNGNLLWTVEAAEPVLGAVTIENGIAYIGASDHTFRAVNIRTGEVKWAFAGVRGYIETKPLVTDNKVIFGAWDNTLYALNKADGKELWKWTGGLTRMHFSPAAVWPVAADGKVFITDPQRAMTAIDIETGNTVWRTFQSMVRETIGLSEDKERIYSKTMNDSIVCYSTKGDQPHKLWASNVGFGYEHAPSMQVEKNGVVFGSTKEGLIFALEAATGKVLWKHKTGNSLISTVVPLDNNRVLFTATSGKTGMLKFKIKK